MSKRFTAYGFTLIFSLLATAASAQYIQVDDNYTAQQLVELLVGNTCADVSNVSVNGWSGSSGGNSYGYFNAGASGFPFSEGIVLSTGFAASAPGPNNSLLSQGGTGWQGDSDLEQALSVSNTVNATILEFDFVPYTDHISFEYMFSSEQYLTSITSSAQCNYTDGFAFLLKEAGSTAPYQNLAVIPGTNIPVKVNTVRGEGVCPAANEQYFGGFNGTNHPTNFNGQTVVLTAQADVVAGTTYHIKLVVADQGNNLYDSAIFLGGGSFSSETNLGPDRTVAGGNPLCEGQTLELNATNPTAIGYQWYRNGTALPGETNATYTVTGEGEYMVEVQLTASCFSEGEIAIEYAANPVSSSETLLQCDEDTDGLTTFNLQLANALLTGGNPDFTVSYYTTFNNADTGTTPITNVTAYQNTAPNQQVYARVENMYGCHEVSTVTLATSANGLTNPTPLETCDEDGTEDGLYIFDLTEKDEEILQGLPPGLQLLYFTSGQEALAATNPITNPEDFENTLPFTQTVYARIYNGSECYGIAALDLVVHAFGEGSENETVTLCGGSAITLDAGSEFINYEWDTTPVQNSQAITVSQPGTYTVTLENTFGCEGSKTFTVIQSGAATGAEIEINDFRGNNNSIAITPVGPGNYEYSIDGVNYQEEPVFEGLPSGQYTVYIQDSNGCGPVYRENVYVLDYPAFFTPNGDGFNEAWRIPFLNFRPGAVVTVFDRYGKIVASFNGASGWDGTFEGRELPATDYWFVIGLENGRTVKGHFSLLR